MKEITNPDYIPILKHQIISSHKIKEDLSKVLTSKNCLGKNPQP